MFYLEPIIESTLVVGVCVRFPVNVGRLGVGVIEEAIEGPLRSLRSRNLHADDSQVRVRGRSSTSEGFFGNDSPRFGDDAAICTGVVVAGREVPSRAVAALAEQHQC